MRRQDSHSLEVSVSDGLNAAVETYATPDAMVAVTFTVTDVNETTAFGGAVTLQVPANDDGLTRRSAIRSRRRTRTTARRSTTPPVVADAASFAIEATTGQLKTKVALEHETTDTATPWRTPCRTAWRTRRDRRHGRRHGDGDRRQRGARRRGTDSAASFEDRPRSTSRCWPTLTTRTKATTLPT